MVEGFFVVIVAAGDDDAEGVRVDFEAAEGGVDVADDQALGLGKSFGIAVRLAVVDDPDVEVAVGRQLGYFLPDVPAADDQQPAALLPGKEGNAPGDVGPRPLAERLKVADCRGGQGIAAGTSEQILENQQVRDVYLGKDFRL